MDADWDLAEFIKKIESAQKEPDMRAGNGGAEHKRRLLDAARWLYERNQNLERAELLVEQIKRLEALATTIRVGQDPLRHLAEEIRDEYERKIRELAVLMRDEATKRDFESLRVINGLVGELTEIQRKRS